MSLAAALKTRPILIAALGLLTLCAVGFLYEMDWAPAGCCSLTWPQPDPAQTGRLLLAKDPKGLIPSVQRKAALDLLAARPADSNAWLRLAYADRLEHGKLTDAGRHALEMSYASTPYAAEGTIFRVTFALENWGDVSQQTRVDCVKEITMAKSDYRIMGDVRRALLAVRNPGGHMAAIVMTLF